MDVVTVKWTDLDAEFSNGIRGGSLEVEVYTEASIMFSPQVFIEALVIDSISAISSSSSSSIYLPPIT